jgi:hypothetical protein
LKLINIWRHAQKVCVHKFWVGYYCFKAGLYWQGLVHDLSKFSPTEFIESVKFYQGDRSPIDACKEANGYSMAWLHHRGRNLHHYENWVDNFDHYFAGNKLTLLEMPYMYAVEMICDYLGAARAYYGTSFTYAKEHDWWVNIKRDNCAMAPHTKAFVDVCLRIMGCESSSALLVDRGRLRMLYDRCMCGETVDE